MTSAQTMLNTPARRRRSALLVRIGAAMLVAMIGACANDADRLTPPAVLSAPYDQSAGTPLWAVAPLRNESGTTSVDALGVSDAVVGALAQVRGVQVLPLNRTIAAMRALDLAELRAPSDIRRLAEGMGVDGVIVGTITAYDPYNPPRLGLTLALYAREGAMRTPAPDRPDPRELTALPSEGDAAPRSAFGEAPLALAAEHLDARNHQVQVDVQRYAAGRTEARSSLGWRRYLVSMDLYTEFASWRTVERLLEEEWLRLARSGTGAPRTRN